MSDTYIILTEDEIDTIAAVKGFYDLGCCDIEGLPYYDDSVLLFDIMEQEPFKPMFDQLKVDGYFNDPTTQDITLDDWDAYYESIED